MSNSKDGLDDPGVFKSSYGPRPRMPGEVEFTKKIVSQEQFLSFSASVLKQTSRAEKSSDRNHRRVETHKQGSIAQKLFELNISSVIATTSTGSTLLKEFEKVANGTIAAEVTLAQREKELSDEVSDQVKTRMANKNIGFYQKVEMDAPIQLAKDNITRAEESLKEERAKLDGLRLQLRNLVRSGSEADDSLLTLINAMNFE